MEAVGCPGLGLRRQVWARDVDLGIIGQRWKFNLWECQGEEHDGKRRGPKIEERQHSVGGGTEEGDGEDAGRVAVGGGTDKRGVRRPLGENCQQEN